VPTSGANGANGVVISVFDKVKVNIEVEKDRNTVTAPKIESEEGFYMSSTGLPVSFEAHTFTSCSTSTAARLAGHSIHTNRSLRG
jgi:hypothetical protein